jgi:transcriptional regulator with XRE-family HTH domain
MGEIHPKMKRTANIAGRNIVGHNVRRIRMNRIPKVTLEDMVARLALRGVQLDRSAIGRIENNDRYVLDYEAVALADALGVEVADLFRKFECSESRFFKRTRNPKQKTGN